MLIKLKPNTPGQIGTVLTNKLGEKFGFDMTSRRARLRFDASIKNFLKNEGLDKGNTLHWDQKSNCAFVQL